MKGPKKCFYEREQAAFWIYNSIVDVSISNKVSPKLTVEIAYLCADTFIAHTNEIYEKEYEQFVKDNEHKVAVELAVQKEAQKVFLKQQEEKFTKEAEERAELAKQKENNGE